MNNEGSLRLLHSEWCWGIGRLAGKTLPDTDGAIDSVSVAARELRSRFELRVHAETWVDTSRDAAPWSPLGERLGPLSSTASWARSARSLYREPKDPRGS
jgi:hypothetical protein